MNPVEAKKFLKSKTLDFMKENKLKYNKEAEKFTFDAIIAGIVQDIITDNYDIDVYFKDLWVGLSTNGYYIWITSKIDDYGFEIAIKKECD